jgi:hypothetical protein
VSRWNDLTGDWGAPLELAQLNSGVIETGPTLSRDEHWLFSTSNRGGNMDVWVSYREHVHDDEGWDPPSLLRPGLNSDSEDLVGGYLENAETGAIQIFFSSDRPAGLPGFGFDFYVIDLQPDGTFGPAARIAELSAPRGDPGMMVTFDGLEAFFYSTRLGPADIWTATRQTVLDTWSAPTLVTALNSPSIDQRPYIGADRRTLYFASDRPDDSASGGLDLYVATRTRQRR